VLLAFLTLTIVVLVSFCEETITSATFKAYFNSSSVKLNFVLSKIISTLACVFLLIIFSTRIFSSSAKIISFKSKKKFHFSIFKSLILYGILSIQFSKKTDSRLFSMLKCL
jgi:hypothetical protein